MLLTIHDANLRKVAFVDNEKQGTLNYYNDIWTRDLETGSSSFEFTVFKKSLVSDTILHKTYTTLNEKSFVSFYYHGKTYLFNVMKVEETEQTITCYCENLNLELINEYVNPYKAKKAMSFVEYCNAMDLLNMTHLTIGINEISDQKRTLEWEGQDTKLARLLSLAHKFDAEIDFETHLHYDSSIKAFIVNVYHEYDDNHNGVGRIRDDIQLTYGKNLKSIKRTIDKTDIYNMIRPTGKKMVKNGKGEEVEQVVTIKSLGVWSEDNADGMREFYQSGEALYAPLSAQLYPSTFTHGTQRDQWTRKDMEVDSDNPTVIRAAAIKELKKIAYPSITYEVDGFLDVEVGDTIRIYDYGFFPVLLVKARVSKQKISFTNRSKNKTVFANFRALKVNRSSTIQAALERLIETAKPYTIKLATDNGVIFKNRTGESLVTPSLYKGTKSIVNDVTWRWTLNDEVTTGMTYLMTSSNVMTTATLKVSAYIGNDEVAVDEVTFVNVNDGRDGQKGEKGDDGPIGPPGPQGEKGALDEEQVAEINTKIDTKAEEALTQEQLNALNELAQQNKAELEAKATLDDLSTLQKFIDDMKEQDEAGRQKTLEELKVLANRVAANVQQIGEMKNVTEFVSTYISESEEGMVIGQKDGSSLVKVSSDRISFVSAGDEVAYISQGVLHIDNGIFAISVQIGHFITKQHPDNEYINMTYFVA